MKKIGLLGIALVVVTACNQPSLQKEEAATVIRAAKSYPKVYEYDVNMADPASAKKLLDAGLESEGLVTVDKTQKLKDAVTAHFCVGFVDTLNAILSECPIVDSE